MSGSVRYIGIRMYTAKDNTIFIGLEYYLGSTIASNLISVEFKSLGVQ